MLEIPEVTIEEANEKMKKSEAVFVDIRDKDSFQDAHIPGAVHLGDHNVQSWVENQPKDQPVVVYCFHGNSSLSGAAYLRNAGFKEVYSMRGGFEAWRGVYPHSGRGPGLARGI